MDNIELVKQTCRQWHMGTPSHIIKMTKGVYEFDIYHTNPDRRFRVLHFVYDVINGSMRLAGEERV